MAALCLFTQVILLLLLCPGALGVCNQPSALSVLTPGSLEALNGSCVQIPCNFTPTPSDQELVFDISKSVFGIWMKTNHNFGQHPENVIFNSSLLDNTYPMNLTGDLRKRDCTTLFYDLTTAYSDRYYLRIENRPLLATAVCDPLQITVKDSAWSPSLEVSGVQTESEEVNITCSAFTPCPHAPPQLTWNLHQGTTGIKPNQDRTFNTTIKQKIFLTDSHDGLMIKCSAAYPTSQGVKIADSNITLDVTYGPTSPSVRVSPSGSISAGQSVTLSCSSRANPPVLNFIWFRRGSQGPVSVSEGDTYNFNLTEEGDFYCVASNELRNNTSPVIKLKIETVPVAPVAWEAILGACVGLLIVLCLVVFVGWYRYRSKRQASRDGQRETFEPDEAVAEEEQSVHYGEIDFSKLTPKVVPNTKQEETVYSEVQVSKLKTTQPTENMDELYANVK